MLTDFQEDKQDSATPSDLNMIAAPVIPTKYATFRSFGYRETRADGRRKEHLALFLGEVSSSTTDDGVAPLVRIHSKCLTGDALGSLRCDCGPQKSEALRRIAEEQRGIFIYTDEEGRNIGGPHDGGLLEKLRTYVLQDEGLDTVQANLELGHPADARDYWAAAHILLDHGVREVRLLTNNPEKVTALERFGIRCKQMPLIVETTSHAERYLQTKATYFGHTLTMASSETNQHPDS